MAPTDPIDVAIASHMKLQHQLAIGSRTIGRLKVDIASAAESNDNAEGSLAVPGRDLSSGRPRTATVSARELHDAVRRGR